ncbi:thioesterase family protein [Variovorax ureilyticus]|uniref:Thioesterase family protein n=1 Tax=Variovorax ureilyticus TaxID=1836198 RepID=A0ABU8VJM3_9BURK
MHKTLKLRSDAFPAPFVQRRMVRFGDTDAAKIVYTVKFFDFAMDALDGWFAAVLDHDWYALNTEYGVSCPFVQCGLDFKAPLRPGQEVAIEILVTRLGSSSLQFQIRGFRPDEVLSFTGRWTCVFVDPTSMQATAIPAVFAQRISAYIEACGESEAVPV